jgi:hypothetical protein
VKDLIIRSEALRTLQYFPDIAFAIVSTGLVHLDPHLHLLSQSRFIVSAQPRSQNPSFLLNFDNQQAQRCKRVLNNEASILTLLFPLLANQTLVTFCFSLSRHFCACQVNCATRFTATSSALCLNTPIPWWSAISSSKTLLNLTIRTRIARTSTFAWRLHRRVARSGLRPVFFRTHTPSTR